ncbi:UNVERIFIED_CONTAM: Transposon Ty3-G Gag-Pol polyprotein [Sesamum calycinum]|uniref:Transposon Ty3-G Gag-Pol polyprotein n=1 Tax=Sesamum calycinum TaxID=2727403 RepID=A0AAW2P980_9LAMI
MKYDDVFKEPSSLPPEIKFEHGIELLPEGIPMKQHPYRYSYGQKTEIERIVKEMLDNGIIKPSQSSFVSPILLVMKKDGGWRLCVDYRGYGAISKPLTSLLKKDALRWNSEANTAWNQLKEMMVKEPVLALPEKMQMHVEERLE